MSQWVTIEAERVLRVSHGRDTIFCDDHCPGPLTIVVKLNDQKADKLRASLTSQEDTGTQRPDIEGNVE